MDKIDGVVYEGAANHFVGAESVGGKLYLMQDRLVFASHKLNVQTHSLEIPLRDIADISFSKTLGFVPNGMVVTLASGAREKFVVNKRQVWVDKINALRG
ncbi:MAG: hypothetical protein LBR44_07850 [Clostridiales Family XIII bacterium]|jgi:hypothetical protein|nr:hypothetical protein [Clostridiales Family XIII bacterium]